MKTLNVGNMILGQGMPKICIPLTGTDFNDLIDETELIIKSDADIVEWRIDYFNHIEDIKKIKDTLNAIRNILKQKPLIFTFRSENEGGQKSVPKDYYFELYREIIASGQVNLIDVELNNEENRIKSLITEAHKQGVNVIISNHDFNGTPVKETILKRLKQMQDLGADLPKIAVMSHSMEDTMRLMDAANTIKEDYSDSLFITISMGEKGLITRICAELLGSALTYTTGRRASAPGQINAEDLHSMLYNLHKNLLPKRFFLIGFMGSGKTTIGKILSKEIEYNYWDIDEVIVENKGLSIQEIFNKKGEEYFRKAESNLLLKLSQLNHVVISCGGGIVENEINLKILSESGTIIFLKENITTIFERIKNDISRPLVNAGIVDEGQRFRSLQSLYNARLPKYERVATIIVETTGKTEIQIAEEIIKKCSR
ncbi:MAG: type I 3-dehydroquinate dehydratase [Anaerovoracaceae bacterium]